MSDVIETGNKFLVGVQGDDIVLMKPAPQRLSKNDAMLLAAWLVALADPDNDRPKFQELLDAVRST